MARPEDLGSPCSQELLQYELLHGVEAAVTEGALAFGTVVYTDAPTVSDVNTNGDNEGQLYVTTNISTVEPPAYASAG